jgi:membrane associated rhomboid family serine protease/cytochrome c-type biogenesis protein CcmH/NrfG
MTVCANCGREFQASSDTETLCPQCLAELPPARPGEPVPGRLRQALESPTIVLIALNTLVYLIMAYEGHSFLTFNADLLQSWGANSGVLTSGGQWWRLLTSTFEHGGLMHIALNMWCLYNLGWLAALLFGRSRFTLLYLMCGIGGSLGSICWRGNGLSVGASGAIFGIAGALIPAMLLHSNQQLRVMLKGQLSSIALFVFYNLAFGAASRGTDNAAHVGGLLTGLALGVAFPTGLDSRLRRGQLRVAAGTVFMLLVFVGAGAFARQRNEGYIESDKASDAHQHGDPSGAIAHAKRAVELKPEDAHTQFMLGNLLLDQHRYADAVEPFTMVTRLRPKWGPAYVDLCVAQRELKLLNEALANCEQGARLSPAEAESWFILGRVRYESNNLTGARDALAKAVSLNPKGFDENLQYALMLISTGETVKAVPYLQKAHDLHPQDEDVARLLKQAQAQSGTSLSKR